jgi:hypothetical protein
VLLVLERNGQFSYRTSSLAKSSCVSHHKKVMHKGRDTTELASCFVQVVIFLHDSWSKQTLNIGGASEDIVMVFIERSEKGGSLS